MANRLKSAGWMFGLAALLMAGSASAQSPIQYANYDLSGSGYVTPAGMMPVHMSPHVMPVGYCDSGCDGMSYCGGGCGGTGACGGAGACGGNCGCGCNDVGGLIGKLRQGGGACEDLAFAGSCLGGALNFLKPYDEAQQCSQRWYDFSFEALVLDRNFGGEVPNVITTLNAGGTPALSLGDIFSSPNYDDLEGGIRVSGALMWGVGGNIEGTYMGGNEWGGTATATSATPNLFSFISNYGTGVAFDDTDNSRVQSVSSSSEFHSFELNYRRRTMFPSCRFQSSWLIGLRTIRYDDNLLFTANDLATDFFASDVTSKNKLFGPQVGWDIWWNSAPAVSVGLGLKIAWVQNDVDRNTNMAGNSLAPGATPGSVFNADGIQKSTYLTDLELKAIYKLSHSITLRGSYYALYVEDINFGGIDGNLAREFQAGTFVPGQRGFAFEDLLLQGFTVGGEYTW